ncbi:hypothetical protein [Nocardia caishijiensis]|uniref:Uncharacterized protein n=1 Tax=Nocardia caishijiensis TaxID=184756 RepID=A0ABQ6YMR1_9NOCA|nr:hypothetical protein [Nocardia caishijiensis]KAF0847072.1 hypothetical protein FNL39_104494 [Nocardia caishijiensis]
MARERAVDRHSWPTTVDSVTTALESIDDPEVDAAAGRVVAGALRALSRSSAEAEAVSLSGYRRSIPGWRSEIRAAATAARSPVQHVGDEQFGIEITRSTTDGRETQVVVTSDGSVLSADDVLVIRLSAATDSPQFLVLIHRGDDGTFGGQIITPLLRMNDDLEITVGRAAALTEEAAVSVEHAVRASTTAGRNAWRRVARALPTEHPVRAAVLAGLGRKPL